MVESQCPSCGAMMQIKNQASLYAVCAYCNTTSLREESKLKEIGKAAALVDDGSPIQLYTQGRYKNKPFEVLGRIQIQFGAGYWNEWHIDYLGESYWLGEANGEYVVTKLREDIFQELPSFNEYQVGTYVNLDDERFYASDIQKGQCISGEGELPFSFTSGYDAPVVDLVSRDENFATIDYSEEKPLIFMGEFQEFTDLDFKNLREIEGFKRVKK